MNKVFFSLSLFLLLPLKIFHCVYLYAYMCVCTCIYVLWIYMHVCAHVSMYVCVCVNIYACVCVSMYVCMCRSEGKLWESVSPFTRASVSRKQVVRLDIENLLPLNHWTPSRALLLSLAAGPANTKSKSSTFFTKSKSSTVIFLSAPPSPFRYSVSAHGHGSQLAYLFTVSVIPVIGFPSKLGRTDMNPTYLAFQQYFPPSYFLRVFPLSSLFPLIL